MPFVDSSPLEQTQGMQDGIPMQMQSSKNCCGWFSFVWWALCLLVTLVMTVSFTPTFIQTADLDRSYSFCIDYASLHHWRFGTDFFGTFGPWGFVYSNYYHPDLWGWAVTAQILIGFGVLVSIWTIARNLRIHPFIAGLWLVVISMWDFMAFDDGRIIAMCVLPLLIRRTNGRREDSAASYVVVLALALSALCKFTFMTASVGAIGLLSLEDLYLRRAPKLGLFFGGAILLLWRVSGQAGSDLPHYLISAWRLAGGYSAAMGYPGPDSFMIPVVLIFSLALSALVLFRFWRSDRVGAILGCLTTLGLLFITFKEGFVRYDGHELAETTALAIMASIYAPILWVRWYRGAPFWGIALVRLAVIVFLATSIWCLSKSYTRFLPKQSLSGSLHDKPAVMLDRIESAGSWIWSGSERFDAAYQQGMAQARASCTLPMVEGTTDMFGYSQLGIIAAGIDYHPRPVAPGFQAWSPELIETNRRWLLSNAAPENIFFTPGVMDNRYPSLDDGPLWPILMTHYVPTQMTANGFLVLHRAAQDRTFRFQSLSSKRFRIGDLIPAPAVTGAAVYVRIKMHETMVGKVGTELLRMPRVMLVVRTADGKSERHRLIPAMAESGFILSPIVKDSFGFLTLMAHPDRLQAVTQISIEVPGMNKSLRWFSPYVEVSFDRLDFSPFSLQDQPELASLANLAEMSVAASNTVGVEFFPGPDGKEALLAHPPLQMHLSPPADADHLHFKFGIRPEAQDKTAGVIFIVSAVTADGSLEQIFSKRVTPKSEPEDRREQETDVPLPPDCSQIVFETRPATSLAYDWAYWADVRFATDPVPNGLTQPHQ